MENLKGIVTPFYTQCLTVNAETDVPEMIDTILADDFRSFGSKDVKTREQLKGQIQFFWKLIPDLKWEIQDMFQDGSTVIVRSMASGTPNGDFMGLSADGSRSFSIMTIDIHTVENGQVVQVYHVEDWPTAMKQLSM